MRLLFLFLIFVVHVVPLKNQQKENLIAGKVIAVEDGDTIQLFFEGKPLKIRLNGIDCPEKKQDFGTAAKNFTSTHCFGKEVKVKVFGKDLYRRTLGEVFLENGSSLNHLLVHQGLAWRYKYSKDPDLLRLEEEARKEKKGLWSVTNPIAPWDFRKSGKLHKKIKR